MTATAFFPHNTNKIGMFVHATQLERYAWLPAELMRLISGCKLGLASAVVRPIIILANSV